MFSILVIQFYSQLEKCLPLVCITIICIQIIFKMSNNIYIKIVINYYILIKLDFFYKYERLYKAYELPHQQSHNNIYVIIWLFILTILTFFMIIIGGLTRLTESGLSMVDWKPVMGFLPPLNYEEWLSAFNAYKNSPEFQIVNKSMNIDEFKYIFWWEWFHRFFARCIGIIFIVPMFLFFIQKKISKRLGVNLCILFLFGIFQALVGWWMVKSGLTENPYVSPYRLAFHLTNAVVILSILFWISLNSISSININFFPSNNFEAFQILLLFLTFLTIISGAFMAGTHAGKSFNTYPLMNGMIISRRLYASMIMVYEIFLKILLQ